MFGSDAPAGARQAMTNENSYPMSEVDIADTKLEITCAGARMILLYVEDKFGRKALEEFVRGTRMNLRYLETPTNWISLEYLYRLLDALVAYTGDPKSPYVAGTYASKKKCFGVLELLCARCASVSALYRFWVQSSARWSRVNEWRVLESGRSRCRISVRNKRYPQNKNNCLSIQGALSAGAEVKGLPPAKVTELQCACEGADSCVYEIAWAEKPPRLWGGIGFAAGLAAGAIVNELDLKETSTFAGALAASVVGYFVGRGVDYRVRLREIYRQNDKQANALTELLRATETLTDELQRKVEERTAELSKANADLRQAIRDLRESEKRVIIAEKQSAVGVLAGGMAHEVNNPINAIRLAAQAMLEDAGGNGNHPSEIGVILRATERCKRIIGELLAFSREPDAVMHVDIREIVERSVDLFQNEHPGKVEIVKTVAPNLPRLRLDKMQIQQAIINLLSNALDAMGGKGRIDVSLASSAGGVELVVKDHGPGIREQLITRIFDPFFTTKESGAGIGIGLSVAYQNVRRNGGSIEVRSAPGQGASFLIRFPVEAAARDRSGEKPNS